MKQVTWVLPSNSLERYKALDLPVTIPAISRKKRRPPPTDMEAATLWYDLHDAERKLRQLERQAKALDRELRHQSQNLFMNRRRDYNCAAKVRFDLN